MEQTTKFYLHTESDSLAHYLVRGVFCPSRFLNNKNRDIQDQFESFLLLSDKQWNSDSDCSIEINLIEGEIAKLMQLQDHYFVLEDCLPISRLRKIYFADRKKAENVIWNINQGAAFVPNWAISFEDKSKLDTVKLSGKHSFPQSQSEQKVKIKMDRYDRLMGGLAFMKIGLLNGSYSNLDTTSNYLTAIAYFNNHIAKTLKDEKIYINPNIQNIFSGKDTVFNYLAKSITFEDVSELGRKEKQKVDKKFNAIRFDSIEPESLTYKLAILHSYGKGKVKSDNDLVSGLLYNTKSDLVEELALIFGLHTGYSSLRNSYLSGSDKVTVKFKLDTKLEFYLIESLYNYAFKEHKISSEIDFLDRISLDNKNLKTKNTYSYINLLGSIYSYKKQEKGLLEKDSLTSLLSETIKGWCEKNKVQVDEEQLLLKLNKSIIPEIRTIIISKKTESKVVELQSNIKSDNEILDIKKTEKKDISESRNNKQSKKTVIEPSLFPELKSNKIELDIDEDNNLTIAQLEKKSVVDLKALCKEKGYKGYSRFKREDLIKFILSQ